MNSLADFFNAVVMLFTDLIAAILAIFGIGT